MPINKQIMVHCIFCPSVRIVYFKNLYFVSRADPKKGPCEFLSSLCVCPLSLKHSIPYHDDDLLHYVGESDTKQQKNLNCHLYSRTLQK